MKGRNMKTQEIGHIPTLSIPVSAEMIENGIERQSNHCIIAEAVKAKHPTFKHVAVDLQTVRATDPAKGERYVWLTPRPVQTLIVQFDAGLRKRLKPFRFTLKGGQIIASGETVAERKARNAKYNRRKAARLRKGANRSARVIPEIVGGSEPPKAPGRRRAYGVRGLVA